MVKNITKSELNNWFLKVLPRILQMVDIMIYLAPRMEKENKGEYCRNKMICKKCKMAKQVAAKMKWCN